MNSTRLFLSVPLAMLAILSCSAQTPAPLASVHTWGDLRALPPVAIPAADNGAPASTYRIGINVAAAKLYGGVIVYCLAKEKPVGTAASMNLGPFKVEVQGPKNALLVQAQQSAYASFGKQASGETLFMKSLPLNEPGDYIITVKKPLRDPKNGSFETVASTAFTVANEPGPIWSPWPLNTADGAVGILAGDDDYQRNSGVSGVANPSTGVAIPKMAACFTSDILDPPGPNLSLPELLPNETDSGIKVQAVGSLLIVTLDRGITPAFPDEKFLTRWWVNGQPFTPKLAPMEITMNYGMRHRGMQTATLVTQITFQVQFHPEFLGAKKGDEIGVQLLLCPQGSEYSGPMQNMVMYNDLVWAPSDKDVRSVEPRLSNRVTFTYTGDPIRMAPIPLP